MFVPAPPMPPATGRLQGYYIELDGTSDPQGERLNAFVRGLIAIGKVAGVQAAVEDHGRHYHDLWPIFRDITVTEDDIRAVASDAGVTITKLAVP